MPSAVHEAIRDLFRDTPAFAAELLADVLRISLPAHSAARLADVTYPQNSAPALSADAVVELTADDTPVLAIVVEVQLARDAEKRAVWPVYVTAQARLSRCAAVILVVALDADVAAWAREPIEIGPGSVVTPCVVGPSAVPRGIEPVMARDHVELAVLGAIAHGNERDGETAIAAALEAIRSLDDDRARCYAAAIYSALNAAMQRTMEEMMQRSHAMKEAEDVFVKRLIEIGEQAGESRGEARGVAQGEARALIQVLAARGLALTDAHRARILACTDAAMLDRWVARAVTAATVDDVLG